MFEVGFTELLLIFALSLVVLGPEKLPKLAQQVGRWVGRARAMARQFREQLDEEAHNLETKINIDPGIDTSMDPRPAPPSPAPEPEAEENFYPPDHHMHSPNREALTPPVASGPAPESAPAAEASGGQAELDLTAPRDDESRPTP